MLLASLSCAYADQHTVVHSFCPFQPLRRPAFVLVRVPDCGESKLGLESDLCITIIDFLTY